MNLDSSRRRDRRAKLARPSPSAPRNQIRRTVRDAARETVRAAILDAAEELIAKHGLRDAALVQIARRAGVAVGTLYNYFTDRDALIRSLFESRRRTFRPQLLAAMAAGADRAFEPRLRGFVAGVLGAFESHRAFMKVAIENEHLKPPGSTTIQDLHDGASALVGAGVREGAVTADKALLLPIVIIAAIKSVAVHRIQTGGALAADTDAIVEILLDGARSSARTEARAP